jgi:hypothetical protein
MVARALVSTDQPTAAQWCAALVDVLSKASAAPKMAHVLTVRELLRQTPREYVTQEWTDLRGEAQAWLVLVDAAVPRFRASVALAAAVRARPVAEPAWVARYP